MAIIDDNPRDVLVRRVQFFSGDSDVVHELVSFTASGAGVDGVPVESVFSGASLSLGNKVSGVLLEAKRERQALRVVIELLLRACLNQISLALSDSMLAGECPVRSILSPLGISIGEEVELANLPEILGVGCGCKGASNEGQAIRTEGLRVEVDFDLAISCNLQAGLIAGLSVIGDESDRCEDKTEEDCFIDHM